MARNHNFTVSERIPDGTALPGQSDAYAALELSCFDGWGADEDPDAYRALSAPKTQQHQRFDADAEDLDDSLDSQVTDLEGLIEALAAEDLEVEDLASHTAEAPLEQIAEAYVVPLEDEGVTLQEFDFREMARILEERERMTRAQPQPQPQSQPQADPLPRNLFVLPLPRGTRVERRLWRREVDRLAS